MIKIKVVEKFGYQDVLVVGYYEHVGCAHPIFTNKEKSLVWCDGAAWEYTIGKNKDYKTVGAFIADAKSDNFIGNFSIH